MTIELNVGFANKLAIVFKRYRVIIKRFLCSHWLSLSINTTFLWGVGWGYIEEELEALLFWSESGGQDSYHNIS